MKKQRLAPVFLSLFIILSSCSDARNSVQNIIDDVLYSNTGSSVKINAEDVTYVKMRGGVGGPPLSRDNGGDTEFYFSEYLFYPNGLVEYTEMSYYSDVLHTESWQKDAENFVELIQTLNEAGYFSLPEKYPMNLPPGGGGSTLFVYAGDECYYSTSVATNSKVADDEESDRIVGVCKSAFWRLTKKPIIAED